ncbi:MAG: hypothetical protein M1142_01675 [Patescibacteria group bacterium]|nr:hypothetical protein [Patescibacteria group bacterium]
MLKEKINFKIFKRNSSKRKITFILLSLIYFSDKKLSYSDNRSAFTPLQRAKQTVKTINSIRKSIPSANIIMIEVGRNPNLPCNLPELCDEFVYLGNNFLIRAACDSRYKGLGEVISLLLAKKYLINKADYFFKISGRYYLTEKFDLSQWVSDKFVIRKYNNDMSTRLYGFPNKLFNFWFLALLKSLPYLLIGRAIEHTLPKFLPSKEIKALNNLGIAGKVGVNNYFLSE